MSGKRLIENAIALAAVALSAGCGGSGSDTPASEPTATASADALQTPAPMASSPGTAQPLPATPVGVTAVTVPTPDPSNPPATVTEPTARVPGAIVLAALKSGIADNPADNSPYTSGCRKLGVIRTAPPATLANTTTATTATTATTGAAPSTEPAPFYLCGAMRSYQLSAALPSASGIGAMAAVAIEPISNGDTVFAVMANGIRLDGPALDLSTVDPQINSTVATWQSDQSTAKLVVMSMPGNAGRMQVCWNVDLPPPPPVTGPPGFEPIIRSERFKRLMCGVYSRLATSPDLGGYLVDDLGGKITEMQGNW